MKKNAILVLGILAIFVLGGSIPPAKAQFVLAGYEYPDDFGQGIERVIIYENSTGSWVFVQNYDYDDSQLTLEWAAGPAIKLRVYSWANGTLVGAGSANEAKNYFKHNVSVVDVHSAVMFEKQNFTYYDHFEEASPMWLYFYDVVIDFIPISGQTYYVTIFYEVYY